MREELSIRKYFGSEAASTAIMYGYPYDHGNVATENSEQRENMPIYLDSVRQSNRSLRVSRLAMSGFVTEAKDGNGNYINSNPISEAEAAEDYYNSFYGSNTGFEIYTYNPESIEGQSKFVEQLHNSLIELRRIGETNIVVHVRIQDTARVRLVLEKLRKQGKISDDIKTMVVSHAWKLDVGDIKGSLAFSLLKFWKMDRRTIKRLDQYQDGNS
jgi:DNA-binding Lrp family transcriptional regulator